MGKGTPKQAGGGAGEEGCTFRSLLGQPAFWEVTDSFITHSWHRLPVQPAAGLTSKCSVKVYRKERGGKTRKSKGGSKGNGGEGRKRDR